MNSFSVLSRTPNWDTLRNIDRPAISLPEFQALPSSGPEPTITSPSGSTVTEFRGQWFPSFVDSTHIDVNSGSVNDGYTSYIPTLTGIVVAASALQYVYLECNLSLTIEDGFIEDGSISSVAIVAYSTLQTNTNSKAYLLLFRWQAGALVGRNEYYNQGLQVMDNNTNTTTAKSHFFPS